MKNLVHFSKILQLLLLQWNHKNLLQIYEVYELPKKIKFYIKKLTEYRQKKKK